MPMHPISPASPTTFAYIFSDVAHWKQPVVVTVYAVQLDFLLVIFHVAVRAYLSIMTLTDYFRFDYNIVFYLNISNGQLKETKDCPDNTNIVNSVWRESISFIIYVYAALFLQ